MLFSIKGKVIFLEKRSIVIEASNFGYEVLVPKPNNFKIGDDVFLFLHHVIKEDDEYLVGFENLDEKNAFKILLNVQGIGPKSALAILSNTNYNDLFTAILNNNVDFIESIPGISSRTASQILLDLKEYIIKENKENNQYYSEVKEALKNLKFKVKDIDRVLPKIYIESCNRDLLFKEALRRLTENEQLIK